MEADFESYESLSLAYDVAYDLSRELERQYVSKELDSSLLLVLSGCYSAVDYFSNRIASLVTEDADMECECDLGIDDYRSASSLMKKYAEQLQGNLLDDQVPWQVDYRKVHALVGLQQVIRFIDNAAGCDSSSDEETNA